MYYSLGKTSLKKAFIITFYILIIFSQFNFGDCWYVIDNSVLRNRCRFNWASWANQSGTWKDATRTRMEWTKKEMEKQLFVKKKDKKENQYFYEEKIEVTNNIFLFFFSFAFFFSFKIYLVMFWRFKWSLKNTSLPHRTKEKNAGQKL